MKKIGLLVIGLLVFGHAEFKRGDNNLTVIDTDTQLEWQDNILTSKKWIDAINYCEDLELDGKNDWRLPNINELKSIVMETQYAPNIDGNFEYIRNDSYWSSTTKKTNTEYKYAVNFTNGSISILYGRNDSYCSHYIRCVRDIEN